ncbi:calcium-transporting atpase [Anaeramoeba flamelloides]|uniref:Calcium-transporting ATPase n=1 Tax=Anaeramoeba flamelloides TaxID=1746091 RepID=A0AAV7ZUN7_9EUKA|nr:calcium-transporting atpase [Anaeramoeba flamelloides]
MAENKFELDPKTLMGMFEINTKKEEETKDSLIEGTFKGEGEDDEEKGIELEEEGEKQENLAPRKLFEELGGMESILKKLDVNPHIGLTLQEQKDNFQQRIEKYGVNRFEVPPHKSWFELLWDSYKDTTLIILIVAAVVSLILGFTVEDPSTGWIEGTAILIAVIIVSVVTASNDYKKEKQFRALNEVKENIEVKVLREVTEGVGDLDTISIYDIVVGDILVFDAGDKIPADCLLFKNEDLNVDQSLMTGETKTIRKRLDGDVFLLSGTVITSGAGRAVVTGVGLHSQWGAMRKNFEEKPEDTPLQVKLDRMAVIIGYIGLFAAILTVLVLVIMWGIDIGRNGWKKEMLGELADYIIIGITIVVVAVPEGLPLAVTISLAYSMKKMMKDNNLVRRLASCETMGNANNICSDKTGTLTENKMTVVQAYLYGDLFDEMPGADDIFEYGLNLLSKSISINSKAFLHVNEKGITEEVGNRTECGLIRMLEVLKIDYKQIRVDSEDKVKKIYNFDNAKKRMSTVIKKKEGFKVYTKGAPEIILKFCTRVMDDNGNITDLDEEGKNGILEQINKMANEGLRTLAFAFRNFENNDEDWEQENVEQELIFIGFVGIMDPLREGVEEAVMECQRAGITVRMVTGDNVGTAKTIARKCGILTEDGLVLEGYEFRKMSEEERIEILPNLQVLARSSPQDKYDLVSLLKKQGAIVGVTGDGTNDAPALQKADVGLSMGIAGTSMAREASDIVLLDDNFKSIVNAVMWGRSVYDNIRKFLQFQLTVNLSALTIAFIGAISGRGMPLRAVQLLWVNLIMDSMAALALGTEPPTRKLLQRKPYRRNESLLSNLIIRNLLCQGAYQVIILLVILYAGPSMFGYDINIEKERIHLYTILFNAFVMCQVFNEINCRKIDKDEKNVFKGIFRNHIFVGIIVVTVIVQFIVVQFVGSFFYTEPLTAMEWFWCILIGFVSLPLGLLFRYIPVPADKSQREEDPEKQPLRDDLSSDSDSNMSNELDLKNNRDDDDEDDEDEDEENKGLVSFHSGSDDNESEEKFDEDSDN